MQLDAENHVKPFKLASNDSFYQLRSRAAEAMNVFEGTLSLQYWVVKSEKIGDVATDVTTEEEYEAFLAHAEGIFAPRTATGKPSRRTVADLFILFEPNDKEVTQRSSGNAKVSSCSYFYSSLTL